MTKPPRRAHSIQVRPAEPSHDLLPPSTPAATYPPTPPSSIPTTQYMTPLPPDSEHAEIRLSPATSGLCIALPLEAGMEPSSTAKGKTCDNALTQHVTSRDVTITCNHGKNDTCFTHAAIVPSAEDSESTSTEFAGDAKENVSVQHPGGWCDIKNSDSNTTIITRGTGAEPRDTREFLARNVLVASIFLAVSIFLYVLPFTDTLKSSITRPTINGPFRYAFTFNNGFFLTMSVWFLFKSFQLLFTHFSPRFRGLNDAHRRNTLAYAIQVFAPTVVVVHLAYSLSRMYMHYHSEEGCSPENPDPALQCHHGYELEVSLLLMATAVIYFFELCLRADNMRLPLVVHHVASIALVAFGAITITGNDLATKPLMVHDVILGSLQAVHAMLEQPTFVALLFYRLLDDSHLRLKERSMFWAWVSFAATKIGFQLLAIIYYAVHFHEVGSTMRVFYPMFVFVVLGAEGYGFMSQFSIWKVLSRKVRRREGRERV